jgi:hypothetical protein
MKIDAQIQLLHQAIEALAFELEFARATSSNREPEKQIEEIQQLVERVLQALEPERLSFRRAHPEASTLHHDVNLLLGKPSRGRLH